MNKTSVYLTDREAARLKALATKEGIPQAEVIRRAIRSYQPKAKAENRAFAIIGVADGPSGSVADIPEKELLDGFGS